MFEPWTNPSLSLEKGVTLSVWRDNFSYFQFVQTVALFLSSSLHNLATEIKLVSVLIENPNFTVANYLQVLLWMHLMAKKKKMASICFVLEENYFLSSSFYSPWYQSGAQPTNSRQIKHSLNSFPIKPITFDTLINAVRTRWNPPWSIKTGSFWMTELNPCVSKNYVILEEIIWVRCKNHICVTTFSTKNEQFALCRVLFKKIDTTLMSAQ